VKGTLRASIPSPFLTSVKRGRGQRRADPVTLAGTIAAVGLNLGTSAGSPVPAAVANQSVLIYDDGSHGKQRPNRFKVAKNCYRRALMFFEFKNGAKIQLVTWKKWIIFLLCVKLPQDGFA